MKIGFLLGVSDKDICAFKNGQEGSYFLDDLYRKYSSLGHKVVVITMHPSIKRDFRTKYNDNLIILGLAPLKHGNISAVFMFRYEIQKIKKIIHEEKFDIIHAHWCYEYAMAALLENENKTIITLHDWPDIVCPLVGNYYWKKRQKLGNRVLEKAKVVTAVSPYIANLYKNKFPNRKISVIPNFIQKDMQNDVKKTKEYLGIVSINNGFNGRKNVKNLIIAFGILREKVPNARLYLIGNEHEKNGIAYQWTKENADITNISFLGQRTRGETLQILHDADILVHPSLEESFGMTLIEAMQQRVFVIAGKDSGAVPWVLGHGKYGKLVDVTNAQEICNAIVSIYSNPTSRKKIVEQAFEYVNNTFSIDIVSESYLKLYSHITQK